MMKIHSLILLALALAGQMVSGQHVDQVVKVTVDGYAYMGDTDTIQAAKERAMKDAERKAVEQGTGVYIESYTKVHNYMTVEDDIKSMATGYISSKKVLIDALENNPPRYHVQIEADVKCGDLEQLIEAKKQEVKTEATQVGFSYEIQVQSKGTDGSWKSTALQDGAIIRSGDRLQAIIRPDNDCYLLMLVATSKNKMIRLLPLKGQDKAFVQAGNEVYVPGKDQYQTVESGNAGAAAIHLFVSSQPMTHLTWLMERLEKSGSETDWQTFRNFMQSRLRNQSGKRPLLASRNARRSRLANHDAGSGLVVKSIRFQLQ
jgi:hypothetical protein